MPISSNEYGSVEYGGLNGSVETNLNGSFAQVIKRQIVANLNILIKVGFINSLYEIDLGEDPIQMEPTAGYPFAIVGMPSVVSANEDFATNKRTYMFRVLVMVSYASLLDQTEGIETMANAIQDQFDNNFRLQGVSDATVLPVEINSIPISTADKSMNAFIVTIKAQKLFTITNKTP